MIAHLHGRVLERQEESIVLEVGGVGYDVATSAATMRAIQHVGAEVSLWIHSHHTQDAGPALYGFLERDERALFETLLGVQGVGPKVALAMLSGLPRSELTQAIAGADIARLMQIRGVGRKTAERLAVELRDKLVPFPVAPTAAALRAGFGAGPGGGPAGAPAAGPGRPGGPRLPPSGARARHRAHGSRGFHRRPRQAGAGRPPPGVSRAPQRDDVAGRTRGHDLTSFRRAAPVW
jgi:holliday junction DNA helicase RuvA